MQILSPDMLTNGILGVNSEITLNATTTDVAYPIPGRLNALTWQAYIDGSGSYEVQATCNKPATVQGGSAKWFSLGGVRNASAQVTIPARVTYIRFIRNSGTILVAFYAA
jgi:hypothetical protein